MKLKYCGNFNNYSFIESKILENENKTIDTSDYYHKSSINESSFTRLWDKTNNNDVAILTVFRKHQRKVYSLRETEKLKKLLLASGYGVTLIEGHYTEDDNDLKTPVKEMSLFVENIIKEPFHKFMKAIVYFGERYYQDSVLFKNHENDEVFLYGTNHISQDIGYHEKIQIGNNLSAKEAIWGYSKIRNKPFVFECVQKRNVNLFAGTSSRGYGIWKRLNKH